jgi:hypothetical protein
MGQEIEIGAAGLGERRGSPEARGQLLREFFLSSCLLALAKRAGFEAMVLDELVRWDGGLGAEREPLACGCGGGFRV